MDFRINTLKQKKSYLSLLLSLSFFFLLTFYFTVIFPASNRPKNPVTPNPDGNCAGVEKFPDRHSKCEFVKSNYAACRGKGFLNYLEIFYCRCGGSGSFPLGYLVLALWLAVLFYILGDTTSAYFCPSVEGLSRALRLSPALAGTTLLPLGNGANDVFSSVVSFARSGDSAVGLNGVLGGALFITCFVVGFVSVAVCRRQARVDHAGFIRDVLFLIFALCFLVVILMIGRISLWAALGFVSVYVVYILVVLGMQLVPGHKNLETVVNPAVDREIEVPLLDEEKGLVFEKCGDLESSPKKSLIYYFNLVVYFLDLPLSLPRKLTIPIVSEPRWSKSCATGSATLAPVFFVAVCIKLAEITDFQTNLVFYLSSVLVGAVLGTLAFVFTNRRGPPKRLLLVWLVAGFSMSIAWTYIIVEEVVSLLIAFGHILGISTSVLGLTVLAWGNSMGDLISNSTLALRNGPDGAQVALSGCYAGPLFNTLIGLGLSLVLTTWREYPSSYAVTGDGELYEMVGFLIGGLLWALVILPKREMRLDKSLGLGLLAIYFCFLFLRLVKGLGLLKLGT